MTPTTSPDPLAERRMRTFSLHRDEDVSGVSGTGRVAEGIEFSDGTVVLRWLTRTGSVAVYLNGADMERVHGHDGKTRVVWDRSDSELLRLAERWAALREKVTSVHYPHHDAPSDTGPSYERAEQKLYDAVAARREGEQRR